jgi:lipopolysaccharide transport system permease protein
MRVLDKKYINLVYELAVSDFKLREQGTVLGFIWTLLNPLLMLGLLYMLFAKRIGIGVEHYGIYLLIGILHWNLFSTATTQGLQSIMMKRETLRNIRIPGTAVVIGSVATVFISFILEMVILIGFLSFSKVGFSTAMFSFPLILVAQLILIAGLSLVLSCLNVYFKDMQHIWGVLLKMGFFLTPIFYPVPMFIPSAKAAIYSLNPMTQIIVFARDALIYKKAPSLAGFLFLFVSVSVIFAVAYFIFKKLEDGIIERI